MIGQDRKEAFRMAGIFSQWKMINDYLVFQSASQLSTNLAGVYYPETKDIFVKSWKPEDFLMELKFGPGVRIIQMNRELLLT